MNILLSRILKYLNGTLFLDDAYRFCVFFILHYQNFGDYSLEEVVQKSCDILSHMTNLTSVVLGPDSRHQTLQHVQLIPINNQSAVAIIVTDQGHTENKVFQFGTDVSMQDIQNCTDLLNDQLVGTPIEDVVDKMKKIEPMMAAKLVRHEVLFEAFVSAFMRFATEKVAVSGRSNMLYQP